MLPLIVVFTALGGVLSALAASGFLLMPPARRAQVLPHLVSFATGTLLGAAFLGLIPHALEGAVGAHRIGAALLLGILVFFLLEKFVLWRHCHDDPCEMHSPSRAARDAASARLILVGDALHNVIDGVLIAAAFMTDPKLGLVTALAVFAHEIPQEVGDLAVLLNGGYSRRQALVLNLLVSLTSVAGGGGRVSRTQVRLARAALCARHCGGELPLCRGRGSDSRVCTGGSTYGRASSSWHRYWPAWPSSTYSPADALRHLAGRSSALDLAADAPISGNAAPSRELLSCARTN